MHLLIVYGTTEGHTRELSHFAARCLRDTGHLATVEEAGPDAAHPDPQAYDAVVIAASLHVGRFQPALVHFARTHHEILNRVPSAFISVSLCAAGLRPDDWEGLEDSLGRFQHETLWQPRSVHHAAGAIRYSEYDFFKRLALKHLVGARARTSTSSRDYDLTDYGALESFLTAFTRELARQERASTEPARD